MQNKGFTLIELLIVIAIIAVLSVVVVLTLNPAELLRQARDSTRISDMSSLNSALSLYLADSPAAFSSSGFSNVCFAHASSGAGGLTPCQDMGFAAGTLNSAGSSSRAINSSGWMRVDFTTLSSGAPFGTLPIDPVNSANFFYGFRTGTTTTNYKLTAKMESAKFASTTTSEIVSNTKDGGSISNRYEVGNDLTL